MGTYMGSKKEKLSSEWDRGVLAIQNYGRMGLISFGLPSHIILIFFTVLTFFSYDAVLLIKNEHC